MLRDPLGGGVSFLIRNRVVNIGRERVLHKNHSGICADSKIAREALVGFEIADRPSPSVEVHHYRQRRFAAARTKNVHLNRARWSNRQSAVLNIGWQQRDRDRGLSSGKLFAGFSHRKRVQLGVSALFNVVQKGLGCWIKYRPVLCHGLLSELRDIVTS